MLKNRRPGRPGQDYQPPKGKLHNLMGGALFGGVQQASPDNPVATADMGNQDVPTAEQMSAAAQPTALSQVQGLQTPTYVPPGFWQNLLSGGAAGNRYQSMQAQAEMAKYQALARAATQDQAKADAMSQLMYSKDASQQQMEEKARLDREAELEKIKEQEGMQRRLHMQEDSNTQAQYRLKAALDAGLSSPEEFNQYKVPTSKLGFQIQEAQQQPALAFAQSPQGAQEYVASIRAKLAEQAAKNQLDLANAKAATTKVVGPGDLAYDLNGGPSVLNRPGDMKADPVKEASLYNPAILAVNPATGMQIKAVPRAAQPQAGVNDSSSKFDASQQILAPAANGISVGQTAAVAPTALMGGPAATQQQPQQAPQPPALTRPRFDSNSFINDFGLTGIPLIDDFLKRRGMFQQAQQ